MPDGVVVVVAAAVVVVAAVPPAAPPGRVWAPVPAPAALRPSSLDFMRRIVSATEALTIHEMGEEGKSASGQGE